MLSQISAEMPSGRTTDDELGWEWANFAVLGFMGVVIAILVWWFWARGWLARERRRVSRLRLFEVEPEKLIGHIGRATKRYK